MDSTKIQIQTFQKVYQNILKYFPFGNMHDLKNFDVLYKNYTQKLQTQRLDDHAFFEFLEIFVTLLKNSHTKISNYPGKMFFFPKNYDVKLFNQQFYLFNKKGLVGKIFEIDGMTPIKKLKACFIRIPASTPQYQKYRGMMLILAKKSTDIIKIKIQQAGNNQILKLKCLPKKWPKIKNSNLFQFKKINLNIGYLVIKTWDNQYFEYITKFINNTINTIEQNKLRGLIIDLRDNTGGSSNIAKELASHFFSKKVIFSKTKTRILKTKIIYKTKTHYIAPQKPYINTPIVIIVNSACLSSCEYFIAGMKDNKRATILGEKTGGGSGNPISIDIPYKKDNFQMQISTWQFYRKNGTLLEGNGITPDVIVYDTPNDIFMKKDKALKIAINILKKNPSN